jgi:hypothetical protein
MPVYTTDKTTINNRAAALCQQIDATFLRIQTFKAWLDTLPDATLISTYGYVQGDIDIMRSAFVDLELLRTIYQGTATQGTLKDFRAFAKQEYPFGSI